jgi:hypothetical protein
MLAEYRMPPGGDSHGDPAAPVGKRVFNQRNFDSGSFHPYRHVFHNGTR